MLINFLPNTNSTDLIKKFPKCVHFYTLYNLLEHAYWEKVMRQVRSLELCVEHVSFQSL